MLVVSPGDRGAVAVAVYGPGVVRFPQQAVVAESQCLRQRLEFWMYNAHVVLGRGVWKVPVCGQSLALGRIKASSVACT